MGRHSPPLDGAVTANGRTLAPFTMTPLQKRGPVAALPRQDDRPAPRRAPDGDTVIRVLAAIVVLAVAAFAAIVSYSHIFELGRGHGQDGTAARLLPLSVDGLIAAASLVMLHAARRKLGVPQLARWMLGLGVGATVAANVEYGMPFGWLAAVVSAWPAVAFVGSVEMAVRFVRDARHDMTDDERVRPGQPGKNGGEWGRAGWVSDSRTSPPSPRRLSPPRKAAPALAKPPSVADVIRDNPGLTVAELAALAGCSERTIHRHKPKT
jgi:hypothetical protein